MFFPEKMLFVNLLAMRDARLEITGYLADAGCLHIVEQQVSTDNILKWTDDEEPAAICDEQLRKIDLLLNQLDADIDDFPIEDIKENIQYNSGELLENAQEELSDLNEKIDSLLQKQHKIEMRIKQLDAISEEMHLLEECGLWPLTIDNVRYLYVALGTLPAGELNNVVSEVNNYTCNISVRSRGAAGDLILLVGDKEQAEEFDRILQSAGFIHHNIEERYRKDFDTGMELVEVDLWSMRDELADITRHFKKNRTNWIKRLQYWKKTLSTQSVLLNAIGRFSAVGDNVILLSGFIPVSKEKSIVKGLEHKFAGKYFMQYHNAEEVEKKIAPPTKLKNWKIFRPFEMFIKNYGLPRYGDIDPTPFVAISFLLMFGMMFGDVGHGAILAAAGACAAFLPYNIFTPIRDLGKILMMAGFSGVIFGFLFGSVFGIENDAVLPALWMRPSEGENLTIFLGAALILGIVIISLGIILNIIQAFKQKDPAKALVGQWSVSSLIFFWMLLGLTVIYTGGHSLPLPIWLIVLIIFSPLLLIIGGQALVHYFGNSSSHDEEFEIATLLFEPIEIVMNLFTNTASFLRVAAFGLAHAALTMVTFILKDMVDSSAINFINVPLQHLFIIVLEGMIVTIQCLRLEYYEFFSKFFSGDGIEFRPLVIDNE